MAAVDLLTPAFGIVWAQDGTVVSIDETQWRAGWNFIGATPPSVEQFNKVHQIQDQKANYLYAQLKSVFDAAAATPSAGSSTTLRDALISLYGQGNLLRLRTFSTSQTPTYLAKTRFVRIRGIGGGGAGGGAVPTGTNACSGGSGGGSGAYVEAIVNNFAGQALIVGAGGQPVSGASGGSGGSSSFAGVVAQGGIGGAIFGPGSVPLTAGNTNTAAASGGYLNVVGQNGTSVFVISQSAGLAGQGANGIWGAGGGGSNGGGDGAGGGGYGSGGGGALSFQNNAVNRLGGVGTQGFWIIEEYE